MGKLYSTEPAKIQHIETDPWPDPLSEIAYIGLAGEIVHAIEPHSEADPVALLAQVLAAFGNYIGRTAHFIAEADCHYANLFVNLVGTTSKGRKGASWGQVGKFFREVNQIWYANQILGGLSSGEGMIWAVRDSIYKTQPLKEKNGTIDTQEVCIDKGIDDKRLLILESEFASVLKVINRERNTLSAIIRQAWDTGNLRTMTKNSPVRSTDAHISIIGHITRDELRRQITETDMANGLANRFLWLCVKRSKCLPDGGGQLNAAPLVLRLHQAIGFAEKVGEIRRDSEARALWHDVYPELSEGKPGLLGAVTSRAEAQVMRLAMIYALLDQSAEICQLHLEAALVLWKYAENSAQNIFGSALGDPVADEIRQLLRGRPEGVTRNDIREHFGRHKRSGEIDQALIVLLENGAARRERQVGTGGRPTEMWFYCT
jgi:hypothetical protein